MKKSSTEEARLRSGIALQQSFKNKTNPVNSKRMSYRQCGVLLEAAGFKREEEKPANLKSNHDNEELFGVDGVEQTLSGFNLEDTRKHGRTKRYEAKQKRLALVKARKENESTLTVDTQSAAMAPKEIDEQQPHSSPAKLGKK